MQRNHQEYQSSENAGGKEVLAGLEDFTGLEVSSKVGMQVLFVPDIVLVSLARL